MKHIAGLIGYPLGHSFSPKWFAERFAKEGISHWDYQLFPLENIAQLTDLLKSQPELRGLNVTIPYKKAIIEYLDELSPEAAAIGAVNVIVIREGKLKGYNTDSPAFAYTLSKFLGDYKPKKAMILGTGGSSKAVEYALNGVIDFVNVSRNPQGSELSYSDAGILLPDVDLLINTTPLGMYPNVDATPPLNYSKLKQGVFAYDLVYNPAETKFMQLCKQHGAAVCNGLAMLHHQAELGWQLFKQGLD